MENSTQRHTKVNCLVENVPQCDVFALLQKTWLCMPNIFVFPENNWSHNKFFCFSCKNYDNEKRKYLSHKQL